MNEPLHVYMNPLKLKTWTQQNTITVFASPNKSLAAKTAASKNPITSLRLSKTNRVEVLKAIYQFHWLENLHEK